MKFITFQTNGDTITLNDKEILAYQTVGENKTLLLLTNDDIIEVDEPILTVRDKIGRL